VTYFDHHFWTDFGDFLMQTPANAGTTYVRFLETVSCLEWTEL